jgi:hypothetical protein
MKSGEGPYDLHQLQQELGMAVNPPDQRMS